MPPIQQGYWQPTPAKPGVVPLRPLLVGDLFSGAIATIRTRPAWMLGVTAIVVTVAVLVTHAATYPLLDDVAVPIDPSTSPSELARITYAGLAITVIGLLVTITSRVFLSGFIAQVVSTAVLGQRPGFRVLWQRVRPRLLPLLGLTLVFPAVAIPVFALVIALLLTVPALGVLAILGVAVVAVWLGIMFSLATPALVLEDIGVGRAFGRSRQLVRGSWWRVAGIFVLMMLIVFAVVLVFGLLFGLVGGFENMFGAPARDELALPMINAVIVSVLTEPFAAAVIVLLYTDQRIRRERLDIALAGAAAAPPPDR